MSYILSNNRLTKGGYKVEIETTVVRYGNGYAMGIPKALVACKILKPGKRYKIVPVEIEDDNQNLNKAAEVSKGKMPLTLKLVRGELISIDHVNSCNLIEEVF